MYGVSRPPLGTDPKQALDEGSADLRTECPLELLRLNRQLLASFLELLRAAQALPSAEVDSTPDAALAGEPSGLSLADLQQQMMDLQRLINSFRPYQAREALIAELRSQVDAKRLLVADLRSAVTDSAAGVGTDGPSQSAAGGVT